jgi:integral membrane protein
MTSRRTFVWIARAEGLSLLLLFGVAMPLKYAAGWEHATWWPGLAHGMLFLAYIGAMVPLARAEGWSRGESALGFLASLVPFGTFAFERRLESFRGGAPP